MKQGKYYIFKLFMCSNHPCRCHDHISTQETVKRSQVKLFYGPSGHNKKKSEVIRIIQAIRMSPRLSMRCRTRYKTEILYESVVTIPQNAL